MPNVTTSPAITIEPKALAAALTAVKPAVSRSHPVAALGGVLLRSVDGTTTISATNLDTSVTREVPSIGAVGNLDVVLPHAELVKAAKLCERYGLLTVASDDREARLTAGARTITLHTLRREDFPPPAETNVDPVFVSDDPAAIATAIERAIVFASCDQTRRALTGALLAFAADGTISLVATDAWRLCVIALPATTTREPGSLLVDSAGLKLAAKAMRKAATVAVTCGPCNVTVEIPGERWTLRTIDAQYPNYQQLVPDSHDGTITASVRDLAAATALAQAFAQRNAPMRISVRPDDASVHIHGKTPDVGSFNEELPGAVADGYRLGEDFEIGVNSAHFADAVGIALGDEVVIETTAPHKPLVLRDGADRVVLMPIRLN